VTTAAEILADAKAADDANAGIVNLLVNDAELERLVAVWSNVPIPPDPEPDEECPSDLPEWARLRWVWSRLEPDPIPAWIAIAGLPDAPHVRRSIAMALDNRIVLPDGTLSSWAQVYVQQQARRSLGISNRPEQAAEPEPEPAPSPPSAPLAPEPYDPTMMPPGRRLRRRGGGV
jgi:hypothetical protein